MEFRCISFAVVVLPDRNRLGPVFQKETLQT